VFNAAVPVLSTVLQDRRESDDARREAAYALGEIGSETSRTVLESHRNSSDPYLAEISREALFTIDAKRKE
jgi:HEAT repeat protein